MDVSIILVNYNTVTLLVDAIDSIIEKTINLKYEIIVVDNNSKDNSQEIISTKYNDDVVYISLLENVGFGRANNEGLRIAKGRNILFLNPDTKLLNNAVKILSDFLDLHVKVGACGGNLYDEKNQPTHSFQRMFPSILFELNSLLLNIPLRIIYGKNPDYNFKDSPVDVAYITGADLMIKRDVLDKIGGGFDPQFFMFYEETELCYRVKKENYRIVSVPDAKIQHLEGKSFEQKKANPKKIRMIYNSRAVFYNLCHTKAHTKISNIILKINILFRLFIFYTLRKNNYMYEYWKIILKLDKNSL